MGMLFTSPNAQSKGETGVSTGGRERQSGKQIVMHTYTHTCHIYAHTEAKTSHDQNSVRFLEIFL